jgi:hypothetical protein
MQTFNEWRTEQNGELLAEAEINRIKTIMDRIRDEVEADPEGPIADIYRKQMMATLQRMFQDVKEMAPEKIDAILSGRGGADPALAGAALDPDDPSLAGARVRRAPVYAGIN